MFFGLLPPDHPRKGNPPTPPQLPQPTTMTWGTSLFQIVSKVLNKKKLSDKPQLTQAAMVVLDTTNDLGSQHK